MKEIKIKVTFIEELLGTASGDPKLHETYIASKSPDAATIEEEVAAIGVDSEIEKSMTVFPRNLDGVPFIYDYQWKGFMKEAAGALRKVKGTESAGLKAFKKEIDRLIFVKPRMIPLILPEGGEIGNCQRPLRAQTMQGERIALSNSETVPAGTTCEFTVMCYCDDDEKLIREWFTYGEWGGTGQWRNSGKGRFTYTVQ